MSEKIKIHLKSGGVVRFGTCYRATILTAKHVACVEGSKLANDNGVYIRSGKSRVFWMASYIAFSK
jgi:hypothetical protein